MQGKKKDLMLVRLFSDIHLEFSNYEYQIPPMPDDMETVLVLAGDVGQFKHVRLESWLEATCPRFRHVVYCPGNHDFYQSSLYNGVSRFREKVAGIGNLHLLDRDFVLIDDVAFIVATLWTNFRNGNPICMLDAEAFMRDYRQIRMGDRSHPWIRKVRASDFIVENSKAKDYIFCVLGDVTIERRKNVVVTHHAPSYRSINEEYAGDQLNDSYASDLDYLIENHKPDYWFHGHIHTSNDYMIGDTRIISNPRGYPIADKTSKTSVPQNPDFNPALILEI
jgi:predicted phosphodiesterase